jgi:phosphoadenosine phosphosulfate reductase
MIHPLAVIRQARKLTDSVCVAISGGRDSLACVEVCHQHGFKLSGYFLFTVPGLEFEEEILRYCERRYKISIHRLPHWDLGDQFQWWVYRKPAQDDEVLTLVLRDVENEARRLTGMQWIAGGQKKCDALERRAMLAKCEGIKLRRRNFYPLADWHHRHVSNYLKMRNVPMSHQSEVFGRSWGGSLAWPDLAKIKQHWPKDFQKIKTYFPFIEAAEVRERIINERSEKTFF